MVCPLEATDWYVDVLVAEATVGNPEQVTMQSILIKDLMIIFPIHQLHDRGRKFAQRSGTSFG